MTSRDEVNKASRASECVTSRSFRGVLGTTQSKDRAGRTGAINVQSCLRTHTVGRRKKWSMLLWRESRRSTPVNLLDPISSKRGS
jgi:hypothetical protein